MSKRSNLLRRAVRRAVSEIDRLGWKLSWRRWLRDDEAAHRALANDAKRILETLAERPLLSILLPVYDTDERLLERCIASVTSQTYREWQLCIADDASTRTYIHPLIERAAGRDARINYIFRSENGNISEATNSALELAKGRFSVLLDHDDELAPNALLSLARAVSVKPEAQIFYSDEDKIDIEGRRFDPAFKPDWSRDLFYTVNYLNHLTAVRTELMRAAGGFRKDFEGSQDHDLLLRCIERIGDDQIIHIPEILYHWRAITGSTAFDKAEKPYAGERTRRALSEHFQRVAVDAEIRPDAHGSHKILYRLHSPPPPRVSLILLAAAGDDPARWRSATDYASLEIISAANTSRRAAALNAASRDAVGEVICFAHSGLQPVNPDWLMELVRIAIQPGVGAVGGKIIDHEGLVADGAKILDSAEGLRTAGLGRPQDAFGMLGRNVCTGGYSAVSHRLMALRRETFLENGGFDEEGFPTMYFDADFCLRLNKAGLRTVFNPDAVAVSDEAYVIAETEAGERARFISRWRDAVSRDPFHNPNLSPSSERFTHGGLLQIP